VEVHCSGEAAEGGCILKAKAAAYGDVDAATGLADELGEGVCAGDNIALTAGGEDAYAASGDDVFQSCGQGWCCIEGTMKGDLHGISELDEGAGAGDIDVAIRKKNAEDDAGCAEGLRMRDVVAHDGELTRGIEKIAAARADEDMDGQAAMFAGSTYEAVAGSEAAFA